MKALKEVGLWAMIKYVFTKLFMIIYVSLIFSPLRVLLLRIMGVKIGKNVILENLSFFNLYRKGLKGLSIGNNCFVGEGCLFDLADSITLKDNVTLGERITVLTHMNVGYKDHPLQKHYPPIMKQTVLKSGCFVGSNSVILAGVTVGEGSLVAAGSVVTKDVKPHIVIGGNPAREIKRLR